jgi:hypothetical protein
MPDNIITDGRRAKQVITFNSFGDQLPLLAWLVDEDENSYTVQRLSFSSNPNMKCEVEKLLKTEWSAAAVAFDFQQSPRTGYYPRS